MILKKGTKLYGIIHHKCPKCQEGPLWKLPFFEAIPRLLKGDYQMHTQCPVCGQHYEIEPGFWWGAMYVAYILSAGSLLITAGICMIGFQLGVYETMGFVLLVAMLGFLVNARLARSIWINLYIKYDPRARAGAVAKQN